MKRLFAEIGRRDRAGLVVLMSVLSLAGGWSGCRRAPAEPTSPVAPAVPAASAVSASPVAPDVPAASVVTAAAGPAALTVSAAPAVPGVAPAEPTALSASGTPGRTIAPSVADLRRAFTTYDRQFRQEDPVCARLAAGIAEMQQAIASNEAAILQRLQADPEWTRLRGELVEFQRAEDARRREAMLRRRGAGVTNNAQPVLLAPRQPHLGEGPGENRP